MTSLADLPLRPPLRAETLKIDEAALVLNVSRSAVLRLINMGILKSRKILGSRRILRTSVEEFLATFGEPAE